MLGIGIDHCHATLLHHLAEQPQLGGEVILESGMIIHMVASDVGEAAGRDHHAVEPVLVQPVARRFDGEMLHAITLQLGQQIMNFHRIGRCVRKGEGAVRTDDADGAQAGGRFSQGRPDFAQEGDDGGLALGAGDGGNGVRLGGEEGGGITR